MKHAFRLSVISAGILGMVACVGGGGSSDSSSGGGGSTIDTSSAFPAGLAVSSPTARTNASLNARLRVSASTAVADSEYAQATDKIASLLNNTADPASLFKAELLMQTGSNANCYGPSMNYVDHPDLAGVDSTTKQFPGGDLGIWKETEGDTTEACASAELNRQLAGVSSRSIMGLMGLAGMISVAKTADLSAPSAGTELDLTAEMNAAAIPNVTFTDATLGLSADGKEWQYNLAFGYNDGGTTRNVVLTLAHTPGASTSQYEGLFSYRVDMPSMGGNCTTLAEDGATMNGTLYYKRNSDTDLLVNSREGGYCGTGIAAATTTDSGVSGSATYLLLDPSITNQSRPGDPMATNADGWGNNFNMFAAQFDPNTLEGDYVYAWQAGSGDSHSRTFQVHMNAAAADGEAYFGFGDWVGTTNGSIAGMICNWAGDGNSHTPVAYAQRQAIAFNAVTKTYEVSGMGSDITYAPTNSCTYDGTTAGFSYDRNLNTTLDSSDEVIVRTSGAGTGELNLDLMSQGAEASMQDAINASVGFALPPL